jgi:PAS domain S-box-containing protein
MSLRIEYLLPFFASLLLSVGLAVYAWGRRNTPGVTGFMGACLSQALWTLGYIFETITFSAQGKIFWDNFQFIAMFGTVVSAVIMAYEYSRHRLVKRGRLWLGLSIFPAMCMLLVYLDPGGILRPDVVIIPGFPFTSLYYPFTAFFWIMMLYSYAGVIAAEVILLRSLFGSKRFYRRQTLWLVAGMSIPILGSFATLLDLLPPANRDITPLTFALGNLVIGVGLFRYHLFDVVPIAHENVIENLSSAVIVIDTRERIVDFNRAAETMLGMNHSDIGRYVSQVRADWAEIASGSDTELVIHTVMESRSEGSQSFFDLAISPIFDRLSAYLGRVVTIHDITAQMQTQQELTTRTRQLEDTNRELESFASSVSHDLRAPLRAIRGFSRVLLKDHNAQLAGEPAELLQHIVEATAEMSELIEGLLALSRQTRTEIVRTQVSLTDLATSVARKLEESQPGRPVTWKIAKELTASADARLMSTALENLLGNAWKYTLRTAQPCIEFGAQRHNSELTYFVRDNGVGFDMQSAERLFTPFQRLHSPQEFPGEGIGLATVQRIIHRHNGRIWAESRPGQGAVFYFTLG